MSRKSPRKKMQKKKSETEDDGIKQWLMMMPNKLIDGNENSSMKVVNLRHRKSDESGLYLFSGDDSVVCEVMKFEEKPRSWFVGDFVQRDGSFYVVTRMNPLFLVLPYLKKNENFVLLDQILTDDEYPECSRLINCKDLREKLKLISDFKSFEGDTVYKFSRTKTLEWLKERAERVAVALEKEKVFVGKGAQVATFVRSKRDYVLENDDFLRYACELVCEYVDSSLSEELHKFMNLEVKETKDDLPPAKRLKLGKCVEPIENYGVEGNKTGNKSSQEPKKLTAAQKALEKVDKSGMKNISHFFSKTAKGKWN